MSPRASVAASALSLLLLHPPASTQDSATTTIQAGHGTLGPAIPTLGGGLDIPAPPRVLSPTPAKHGAPTVPVGPRTWDAPPSPPTVPATSAAGPSLAGVTVYRNSIVRPVGANPATVGEPSTSKLSGSTNLLQTGNFYAANSTNNGSSWSYINPYTLFGAIDGGFCCDQLTINHDVQQMTLWLLQYAFSATTNRGSFALGVGPGIAGASFGYLFDPTSAGFPAGTWFDFPHLAVTRNFVFITANVFNAAGAYQGSCVLRINAAQARTGGTINFSFARSDSATPSTSTFSSARFALGDQSGTNDVMYWASHVSSTSLRIFAWPDTSGSFTVRDRAIATWYSGTTPAPGPDALDWTARADNRIQAGFQGAQGSFGWAWHSNAGGSFPRNFTRMVRFRSDYTLDEEASIWNSTIAYMYPSIAPSSAGHLGGTILGGGGAFYPHTLCWIMDDLNGFGSLDNNFVVNGTSGPAASIAGDYLWSQSIGGNKWIGVGLAQVGGSANANSEHHNAEFGRADTSTPATRTINITSSPAGAGFTIDRYDYNLLRNGNANTTRTFRDNAAIAITAAATLGARQFYRWTINGNPQPIGLTTLNLVLGPNNSNLAATYGTYTAGSYTSFGTGCAGSNGTPNQTTGATLPEITRLPTYLLANGPRNSAALLVLGFSNTLWNGIPLPLTLPGTPCSVRVEMAVSFSLATNASGAASAQLAIPNDVTLIGGRYHTQFWNIDVGVNPFNLTFSNGMTSTIGGWNLN